MTSIYSSNKACAGLFLYLQTNVSCVLVAFQDTQITNEQRMILKKIRFRQQNILQNMILTQFARKFCSGQKIIWIKMWSEIK
jgi:hypothetical protein